MKELIDWEIEQIEYNNLINKQKNLKITIKAKKKQLHQSFKKDNKKKLLLIDFLFVFFILFNIGALLITNAMVMKNPNVIVKEANPLTADIHNLQSTNNNAQFFGIIFHIVILSLLIGYYFLLKSSIFDNQSYILFLIIVIFIGTLITYDFLNDLGYLIGKLIWR